MDGSSPPCPHLKIDPPINADHATRFLEGVDLGFEGYEQEHMLNMDEGRCHLINMQEISIIPKEPKESARTSVSAQGFSDGNYACLRDRDKLSL